MCLEFLGGKLDMKNPRFGLENPLSKFVPNIWPNTAITFHWGSRSPTILEPPALASLQPPAAGWKVAGDPGINTKRQRRMACPAAHQQPMEIQDPNGTPTENVPCAHRRFHVCISWCIFTLVSICYIMCDYVCMYLCICLLVYSALWIHPSAVSIDLPLSVCTYPSIYLPICYPFQSKSDPVLSVLVWLIESYLIYLYLSI